MAATKTPTTMAERLSDKEACREAMRRGVYDAFRRRKKLGLPIYGWDEEKQCVVEIPAKDIEVPPEYAKDHPFPLNED